MKYFLKTATAVLIFVCLSLSSFAQNPPIKFGDIPLDQLKMKVYEKDSSASAVILADYGKSYIDYRVDQFQVIFERHVRIKIMNKDGYEWANHEIQLYHENDRKEKFSSLKGITYNLIGSKVVKNSIGKESIFEERLDDNRTKLKFTMPMVQEGSIVEFTYKVSSDFLFNYRGWRFQETIPVVWSEYQASFIEYYRYQSMFQGYIPMAINEKSEGRQRFTIRTESKNNAMVGHVPGSTDDYEAQNTTYRWVAKDVPAFVSEPYMTTANDYISLVNFELESINWPNQPIKYVRGTWEKVNEQFNQSDFFGQKLSGSAFLKKELETVISDEDSDEEKIAKVYSFVRDKVQWNGQKAKYLSTNLKKPLDDGSGSSAEINLLLVALLKKAGLTADAVLISTRDHGRIKQHLAVSSQFNYVICKVQFGDSYALLDATEPYLPINALPERCLNSLGYVISDTNPGWVGIPSSFNKKTTIGGALKINDNGEILGSLTYKYSGYNSLDQRKNYYNKGEEDFLSDKKSSSTWGITDIEIENKEDLSKPFVIIYDAQIDDEAEILGNIIYLNPMLTGKYEKNPFTLEKREYPIDFSCPIEELYYTTFTLPEGYQLETPIKPFSVALPERAGRFTYNITLNGNTLTVMSKLNINKTQFVMGEYLFIKEFFAQIVAKQNEQIVLKKS